MNWPSGWLYPDDAEPVVAERGVVVTTDRLASEVGARVLADGGNAVDAAVATAFALAVVNPEAGNLGGGGYLLARSAAGRTAALDFRSTAPAAARRELYDGAAERARTGHLAVAVPGSVRGLHEAHRRLGRLPWAALVEPAVELARGFTVGERLLRSYVPDVVEGLGRYPASAGIFLPGGTAPEEGSTFRQADLARTLELVRDEGADGFYGGAVADRIHQEMERGGGVLTKGDLAAYEALWREPLRFRWGGRRGGGTGRTEGHTVLSMPPSSSGGVALAESARIVEALVEGAAGGRRGERRASGLGALPWHGASHVHLLAEAWRRTWADRNRLVADPAFVDVPTEVLTSEPYGRWRARGVSLDRATPSEEVGPGVEAYLAAAADGATTHLSVVGPDGDAVSLTTTLNTWYGSKVVAEGTGVLLNNVMDDLTIRPGEPNYFGLVQGVANAVAPGKRPVSAMSPTLVLGPEGRLRMVVGTPGGATIVTTVFQVVSNVLDHGMGLARAVLAPRVHHQHLPDRIEVEPEGLPEEVVRELRGMGHRVHEREEVSGDVQAVLVRRDGTLEAQADPRRGGAAVGV